MTIILFMLVFEFQIYDVRIYFLRKRFLKKTMNLVYSKSVTQ